jgi:hypothetical protein
MLIGALDNIVEISDRLVRVNEKGKLKFRHYQTSMEVNRIT